MRDPATRSSRAISLRPGLFVAAVAPGRLAAADDRYHAGPMPTYADVLPAGAPLDLVTSSPRSLARRMGKGR